MGRHCPIKIWSVRDEPPGPASIGAFSYGGVLGAGGWGPGGALPLQRVAAHEIGGLLGSQGSQAECRGTSAVIHVG